jgi:hypothetical protein
MKRARELSNIPLNIAKIGKLLPGLAAEHSASRACSEYKISHV